MAANNFQTRLLRSSSIFTCKSTASLDSGQSLKPASTSGFAMTRISSFIERSVSKGCHAILLPCARTVQRETVVFRIEISNKIRIEIHALELCWRVS